MLFVPFCGYSVFQIVNSKTLKCLCVVDLAVALYFAGWMGVRDYKWEPADASRWNLFAIKESGVGRTLARILTEEANTSYHHGLFEQRAPLVANAFSQWLDAGTNSLGFPGRLKYRPVEKYPLRPYEVKEALEQAEKNIRLAFELDPENYTAYDVYFFFLTTHLTQTEFASMNGTQLKDEDEDNDEQANKTLNAPALAGSEAEQQKSANAFQQWAGQERERRQKLAIEITDEAIRKFRPNTEDPERFLSACVMWYNRFLLLEPNVAELKQSAEARKKFEEVAQPALNKMKYYIEAASRCQRDLEKKGLWQAIPERRKEYYQVRQVLQHCAMAVSAALQNNRAAMAQDPGGSPGSPGPDIN